MMVWGSCDCDVRMTLYPGRPDKEDKKLMSAVRDQCVELKSQPLQQKWGGYSCVTFSSYFLFPNLLVFAPDLLPVWRSGPKTPDLLTPPPSLSVSCLIVSSFLPHPPISPSPTNFSLTHLFLHHPPISPSPTNFPLTHQFLPHPPISSSFFSH